MSARVWFATLIAAIAILAWWLYRVPPAPSGISANAPPPAPAPAAPSEPPPTQPLPPPQVEAAAPNAARPPVPEQPMPIASPAPPPVAPPPGYFEMVRSSPEFQQVEELALSIRHFGQRFGGNPTGSNAEITKALNGGNEKRAIYLPPNAKISEQGELLDPWGNPYFFHSNSATDTEVRSAGPDGIMHNRDDLVTK